MKPKLKEGDRVIAYGEKGIINNIECLGKYKGYYNVRRDDGMIGVGSYIEGYGRGYIGNDSRVFLDKSYSVGDNIKTKVNKENIKMKLKDIKKVNTKEAVKQYNEEKANEEIEFAKTQLRNIHDNIDRCDRYIKQYQEEKKGYSDKLKELNI